MYERSAIVLERYMEKILRFNKTPNLKQNSKNYNELIDEIENYQIMTNKVSKVIQEFDNTAKKYKNCNNNKKNSIKPIES